MSAHHHSHQYFAGPIGWSAGRRVVWAFGLLAVLWAAVGWALA